MLGNIGIQWLMVLGVSALWTGYAVVADVETKVDEAVVASIYTEFAFKINDAENRYLEMVYQIQKHNRVSVLDATTDNKKGSPFEPVSVCVVSEDELKEIANLIEDSGKDAENPPITTEVSSNCTELDKIKFGMLKLRNDIKELRKNEAFSAKYVELKAYHEEKVKELQKQIDEARKAAADDVKAIIDSLRTQLQAQEEYIRSILKELEDKQKELNDTNINLAGSKIRNVLIDEALEAYQKVSDKTRIKEVVEAAYGNGDIFQPIFDFIRRTDDSISLLNGYTTLFNKMKDNNHMYAVRLLILTNGVGKNKATEFDTLLSSLLESLKNMHRNSDYDTLFNYQLQQTDDEKAEYGNEIMPLFIRTGYDNDVSNTVKLLDLSPKFAHMIHRLYLLNSLISEMKKQGHANKSEFLIVINDLINIRVDVYKTEYKDDMETVDQVYENVPEHLRPLMYKNLCIQSVDYKHEFLTAGDLADDYKRYIFTGEYLDADALYQVKFLDRGRKVVIKNTNHDQHVYASGDGASPRNIYAWTKGSLENDDSAQYAIEGVDDKTVRIKNLKYGEYLFSPSETFNYNYRRVFSSSETASNSLWKLTTCQLPI